MKILLKLSVSLIALVLAGYASLVIGYHCSKDFRWKIKDLITETQFEQEIDGYLAKGLSAKEIKKMIIKKWVIIYAYNKIVRANEPEFIAFHLP